MRLRTGRANVPQATEASVDRWAGCPQFYRRNPRMRKYFYNFI